MWTDKGDTGAGISRPGGWVSWRSAAASAVRRPVGRGARCVLRAVGRAAGNGRIVRAPDGRRFTLDLSDPDLDLRLLFFGSYEPFETRVLSGLLRPGDTAVDVGANFGWYTTLFAGIAGPAGSVHSFEPNPVVFRELEANVQLNSESAPIFLNRCAVGSERGATVLHVFAGLSPARASVSTFGRADYVSHECPLVSLDSYFLSGGHRLPDLVKCDVEGSEMAVLLGSSELLASPTPPIWLLEINDEAAAAFGYVPADLLVFLAHRAAYRFYRAGDTIPELERPQDCRHGDNILCIPDSRLARLQGLQVQPIQ